MYIGLKYMHCLYLASLAAHGIFLAKQSRKVLINIQKSDGSNCRQFPREVSKYFWAMVFFFSYSSCKISRSTAFERDNSRAWLLVFLKLGKSLYRQFIWENLSKHQIGIAVLKRPWTLRILSEENLLRTALATVNLK